jgi:pimeloyl-ACP methyl ester carboxylesterase
MDDPKLIDFETNGLSLPPGGDTGFVETDGARIHYAAFGDGPPVILLHGGMSHAGHFGKQVPALVAAGHRVVAIDSRGHGQSTWDGRPFSYDLLAADTLAVMDALGIPRAAIVGWSDGACTGLALAKRAPDRVAGVFFFACNVDDTGTKPFVMSNVIGRCGARQRLDYAALSATPDGFDALFDAVGLMQRTLPNYSAADLRGIAVPVTVAQAEHDEFIKDEHAAYIAGTIPNAELVELKGVSHFAMIQRPELFNAAVLTFLSGKV